MKALYILELLALFIAGMAGVIVSLFGWIGVLFGGLIIALDSYFIISKLKEQTIKEYLKLSQKIGGQND